jgi:hypothetical protein
VQCSGKGGGGGVSEGAEEVLASSVGKKQSVHLAPGPEGTPLDYDTSTQVKRAATSTLQCRSAMMRHHVHARHHLLSWCFSRPQPALHLALPHSRYRLPSSPSLLSHVPPLARPPQDTPPHPRQCRSCHWPRARDLCSVAHLQPTNRCKARWHASVGCSDLQGCTRHPEIVVGVHVFKAYPGVCTWFRLSDAVIG